MNWLRTQSIARVGALLLLLVFGDSFTQIVGGHCLLAQQHSEPAVGSSEDGEYTSAMLDAITLEARQTGSLVIVISSLGTGDTRPNLHKRRLHNAVARIVDYQNAIPRKQVITAIADCLKSKGKVEFFVNGKLKYIVWFKPNADFTMDCCDGEYPNYYPWYKGLRKKPRL
jgi:hypothetical protein